MSGRRDGEAISVAALRPVEGRAAAGSAAVLSTLTPAAIPLWTIYGLSHRQ